MHKIGWGYPCINLTLVLRYQKINVQFTLNQFKVTAIELVLNGYRILLDHVEVT